jgi:hypothetical protein
MLKERSVLNLNRVTERWDAIHVNDGARDSVLDKLAAMRRGEPHFKVIAFSILSAIFVIILGLVGFRVWGHSASDLPGWSGIVVGMLLLNGIQFLMLRFLGESIGRIYSEVKQRPRWFIAESLGVSVDES